MKNLFKQTNFAGTVATIVVLVASMGSGNSALASATSSFTQVINPGTLSVDIVNTSSSYASVTSPSVAMSTKTFSWSCQTSTGTFGTATQAIYVSNPDAANNGWTIALAASDPTDLWTGTGASFDFNDPSGSGCTDGAGDADSLGGQMTVNASAGTLAKGNCSSCTTSNISKGTSAAFNEGTVDSITLLTASASSDDIGDWTLQGVSLSQKIPAEQPAASDYALSLTLSVTAS